MPQTAEEVGYHETLYQLSKVMRMPIVQEEGQKVKINIALLGAISVAGAIAGGFFGSAAAGSLVGVIVGGVIGLLFGAVAGLVWFIIEVFS